MRLIRGVILLVVLWALVIGGVKIATSMKPTAEKVSSFIEKRPLADIEGEAERKEYLGRVAEMMNQMEASEVNLLAEREANDPRRRLFQEMTPSEQRFFLEKRIGRAFQQMMQSFNEMERSERQRIVERSLKQMRENPESRGPARGPGGLEEEDPELAAKMAEAGLEAYYTDASVETKIDLAPLMEEMQRTMGQMGRRR